MALQDQLQAIASKKKQIENNPDLSPAGKDKALNDLAAERANLKASALRELGASWSSVRSGYRNLQSRGAELDNQVGASWDYGRLNYMAQVVRSKIAQAEDTSKLTGLYSDAQGSGDYYIRRAWAEIAPQAAIDKFGLGVDTGRLQNQAARDLQGVIYHQHADELQELKADWDKLINRALDLHGATRSADSMLDDQQSRAWGQPTEFDKLLDGIRLDQTVEPQTLTTFTTLTVSEPSTGNPNVIIKGA